MTDRSKKPFVDSLDPRTKFLAVTLLAMGMVAFNSHWVLIAPAGLVAVGTIFSSMPASLLLKRLRTTLWFTIFIVGINTFSVGGATLFELWGLYATSEGLVTGLVLSAKIVLLLLLSALFVYTTPIADMLDGLETGIRPFRKRFGHLVLILSITLSFVPMLFQSAQRIKLAQIARGADIDSSFVKQVRFAFSAALPLFASAFRSSEQLALAMEARCFDPHVERSQFRILTMKRRDRLVLLGASILVGVTAILHF